MPILTESKVKKLLKTTDMKKSKILLLESGTIITPAAKSYLTGIKVEFQEKEEEKPKVEFPIPNETRHEHSTDRNVYPVVEQKKELAQNHFTFVWNNHVECLISDFLSAQQVSFENQQKDLIPELDKMIQVLKDFRKMDFCKNYWLKYGVDEEGFRKRREKESSYSPVTFIPSYSDGREVVMFYRLYTQVNSFQIHASKWLQPYLNSEEYFLMLEGCRWMADYIWSLMIGEKEKNVKRGKL